MLAPLLRPLALAVPCVLAYACADPHMPEGVDAGAPGGKSDSPIPTQVVANKAQLLSALAYR